MPAKILECGALHLLNLPEVKTTHEPALVVCETCAKHVAVEIDLKSFIIYWHLRVNIEYLFFIS
jgi:hypothetical protein